LGTFGIGIISQVLNLNNLIVFFGAFGIPLGVTKFVSQFETEKKWDEIYSIIQQINTLFIFMSLFLILICMIFSVQISEIILEDGNYYYFIILLAISIPFSLYGLLFDSYIKGFRKFGFYSKISIISSFISTLIALLLVFRFELYGAALFLLVSPIGSFIIYLFFLRRYNYLKISNVFKIKFKFDQNYLFILKLGAASLIVGMSEQLVLLAMRTSVIQNLGVVQNGIFQSVYTISMNYFNVLFISIGAYLLPVLSGKKDILSVNAEINSVLYLTLLVIVPLITVIFVLRDYVITILYSSEFLPASDLLFYNFFGDYFKAISWILGAWLIPSNKIKVWAIFSLTYYVLFFVIFYILFYLFGFGLKSIPVAYSISYFLHFLVNWYYIYRYNEFRLTSKNLRVLIYSISFLIIILILSNFSMIVGYFIVIPSVILWFVINVKIGDLIKLKELIKGFLKV
jgi:PST family polysaccharide transporter